MGRKNLALIFFFWISTLCGDTLWQGRSIVLQEINGYLSLSHYDLKPFSSFSDDEFVELEYTAAKLEAIFEQIFGLGDYFRVIPLEASKMAIYPVGAYDNGETMSFDWLIRNTFSAIEGKKELLPSLDAPSLKKIASLANEQFSPIPLVEGTNKWVDIQKGLELLRHEWNKRATQENQLTDPFLIDTLILKDRKLECLFFCNPDKLAAQGILDTPLHTVVVNYRPYTNEEHLMIAPKRHVEKISSLTEEEIIEKYHLVLRLHQALRSLFPNPSLHITLVTKAGWKGGQTEPHLHDHIIVGNPSENQPWMRRLLDWARTGLYDPPLNPEEIENRRKRIHNVL